MRRPITTTPTGRRSIERRCFQTEFPVICRRVIHWGDKSFRPGDAFPWKELGVPTRKMVLLFKARKIRHAMVYETMDIVAEYENGGEKGDETGKSQGAKRANDAAETDTGAVNDGLDDLKLADLREMAARNGIPRKPTKALQLAALRRADDTDGDNVD